MKCPFCRNKNTYVKDSRPEEQSSLVRRRRFCQICDFHFITLEKLYMDDMYVEKKNGKVDSFDREKMISSISIATRKRFFGREEMEELINEVEKNIQQFIIYKKITSQKIGEIIMEKLSQKDIVSYVRYASVYKNFKNTSDFDDLIKNINNNKLLNN